MSFDHDRQTARQKVEEMSSLPGRVLALEAALSTLLSFLAAADDEKVKHAAAEAEGDWGK